MKPNITKPVPGNWFKRLVTIVTYQAVYLIIALFTIKSELTHRRKMVYYFRLPRKTVEVAVLTGGTRGLGTQVLKKLLQMDFTVIVGARSTEAGMTVVKTLRKEGVLSGRVKCYPLELKSLASVRSFANSVLKETKRIDLLINNAGIAFHPWEVTEDNLEVHFQVNFLSHSLLTQLLLPRMEETGRKRETSCKIINVSSVAHRGAFGNCILYSPYPKIFCRQKAYSESKLCQILYTKMLNKSLQRQKSNVSVFAVHPGVINTDIWNFWGFAGYCVKSVKAALRSMDDGAEEIMLPVTSSEFENKGGIYIENSKKARPSCLAEKKNLEKQLWNMTHKLLNDFKLAAE